MVFYMLDINDMCFVMLQGFNSGEQFFIYLKDVFDVLFEEGEEVFKMFFVGFYNCIIGWFVCMVVLQCFIEYVKLYDKVWLVIRE